MATDTLSEKDLQGHVNRPKKWFWIVGGSVLLIVGILAAGLGILGLFPWQRGDLYVDPQGRFSVQVGSWEQVETDEPYAWFKLPDPPINLYLLVLEASTIDEAFSQTVEIVGFDPGLLTGGAIANVGDWQAYTQEDSSGLAYGLAGQISDGKAYLAAVSVEKPGVGVEHPAVMRALASLKVAGKEEVVIESYADLEGMVQKQVDSLAGSVSVAVLNGDKIVYSYVYGEANPLENLAADPQTMFRYGSMTKPFTASALMQLVEQGRVDLDAWPGEYIPEFPKQWNVTVRQLLDHSACLPDSQRLTEGLITKPGESFASLEEIFTSYVRDYPALVCEPGIESQYSNPNYLALARIIEEVSGDPYEKYVVDYLLTPLEMQATSFQLDKAAERYAKGQFPTARIEALIAQLNEYRGPGQENIVLHKGEAFSTLDDFRVLPPWGGLFGTPSDLTHFLQMHLNGGRYGDNQVLQPETVAAMQEMQKSTNGSSLGYGLSWVIGEDEMGEFYYHGGGGPSIESMMRFYPDLDLGVVVMTSFNGSQAEKIAEGLVSAWVHEK